MWVSVPNSLPSLSSSTHQRFRTTDKCHKRILLGLAHSLARELNIQSPHLLEVMSHRDQPPNNLLSVMKARYANRRRRIQALLFILNNPVTSSFAGIPNSNDVPLERDLEILSNGSGGAGVSHNSWLKGLAIWARLAKLARAFNEQLFEGPHDTAKVIQDRLYVEWLRHAYSLLGAWHLELERCQGQ